MGSVADLYTTGDNDPEIEPEQYYRHYLYCDACGSFELEPWLTPENHAAIEKTRKRLATAAWLATPLVLVAAWEALGFFPSPAFVLLLAVAAVIAPVLWGLGDLLGKESVAWRWRFTRTALLWLPAVALTSFVAGDLPWRSLVFFCGLIAVVGLWIARGILGSKIEVVGRRCRQCGATYAHGTAFFTDLDANPRQLTVADVPRPLGSSHFLRGKSVAYEPSEPPSRLPE